VTRWALHPFAVVVARLALGGVLVYASLHKIVDPPDFALIIYNYRLFPAWSIHGTAIVVPWVELLAGLALLPPASGPAAFLGRLRGGAALLAALLFASFIAILGYNLWRECPTICGCFSTHADGTALTVEEKFAKMRSEIALDCGLVLLAAYSYVATVARRDTAASRLTG
jgi:uncharacterized membrane protein YphA (DoxX/SURF4 family)